MIYQLVHVVVSIEFPHAALQVQVLVQIYRFLLPHRRVELVRLVVTGTESQLRVVGRWNETQTCFCLSFSKRNKMEQVKYKKFSLN